MRLGKRFGLYLILSEPRSGYERCARAAVSAGVRCLQLRMKQASPGQRERTARRLRELTAGTATRLIINDCIALARKVGADGVHLGQDDPGGRDEVDGILGVSTHSREQALRAEAAGADYIGVGPVYATPTKPDHEAVLGPVEAARIAAAVHIPAVAIGGIHEETLDAVLDAGLENFCVVSAVNAADEPETVIERLMRRAHL